MGNLAPLLRVVWLLSVSLQVIGLLVMTVRKQLREFNALYIYLIIGLAQTPLMFAVYSLAGYQSWTAFRVGWISQAVVVFARWVAVCQLCQVMLSQFRGIWGVTWRALLFFGLATLGVAVSLGGHDFVRIITTFDMGIELSIATVLAAFFAFARYYQIHVLHSLRSMGVAFCLYSCFRALNDAILQKFLREYSNAWNLIDGVTYVATLALIVGAVYLLRDARQANVRLLSAAAYAAYMPAANARLLALNNRLSAVLKSKMSDKI